MSSQLTKRMQDILTRYGVKMGKASRTVTRVTTKRETILGPTQFAMWEAAVKAQYVSAQVYNRDHVGKYVPLLSEFQTIADVNDVHPLPELRADDDGKQAEDDFKYCATLLNKMVVEGRNVYLDTLAGKIGDWLVLWTPTRQDVD